ncbi:MAG: malto-oligosyltrehalose trehalohydrolase [Thermomicrobiales bacterium]
MNGTPQRRRAAGVEILADGSAHARVWAPYANDVAVVLEGGPGAGHQDRQVHLSPQERGYFAGGLPGAGAGTRYRLRLDGDDALLADPASRLQPEGVHGPSEIVDPAAFAWEVDAWDLPSFRDWVIYELHVGTFTPEGTFAAIAPRLPYLKDLGVTAIELMPIAQFPGERNWGYDGVLPYAAQHSYGGPDGLRRLVDACHREGIAVILDVVYNHLGPEGNVVHHFGPYFTDRYRTPWGDAINFDGPGSDEVRAFFIDSALMWLEECRVDGFRLDAVHQIFDPQAQPVLAELAAAVHGRAAALGRQAVLIAESDLNDPKLVLPRDRGGYALDAQWADDFCHALEAQLLGVASAFAADYGGFSHLGKALREAFVYTGQYSPLRQRRFGRAPHPARRDQFVVFLQNHDQVGNRPGGERLGHLISFPQQKLAAATVLLSPFVPLLFMGEEYGEPNPFLYVTHHTDPDLVEAVRAGRREEFAHWAWDDAAPDPQDAATFERSQIQPERHREGEHQALHAFYRELLTLRRALPVMTDPDAAREVIEREAERVFMLHAQGEIGETIAILSFADVEQPVSLPIPAGEWRKRLDANDARFLGGGAVVADRLHSDGVVALMLPSYAALLFERAGANGSPGAKR